ncbi:MAG: hypothetical protein PUC76_09115 [Clostridia bacterium]|nr:hypothetical protein [Clostridia bacterium]
MHFSGINNAINVSRETSVRIKEAKAGKKPNISGKYNQAALNGTYYGHPMWSLGSLMYYSGNARGVDI